jgi:hypothetical protein
MFKNIFCLKNQTRYQKTQNFTLTEKCTIFTFTHVRQNCFASNLFLVHFLKTFSKYKKNSLGRQGLAKETKKGGLVKNPHAGWHENPTYCIFTWCA